MGKSKEWLRYSTEARIPQVSIALENKMFLLQIMPLQEVEEDQQVAKGDENISPDDIHSNCNTKRKGKAELLGQMRRANEYEDIAAVLLFSFYFCMKSFGVAVNLFPQCPLHKMQIFYIYLLARSQRVYLFVCHLIPA